MRSLLALVVLSACSASVADPADPPVSVRDRLEREPTSLAIQAPTSAGAVTAERRADGNWNAKLVDLAIDHGELVTAVDADGLVTVEHLVIGVGPIEIPETVLGYGAQLTHVEVTLEHPIALATAWDGDDAVDAHGELELALSWSLVNHGSESPLGSPELPPVPVQLSLTGNADVVHAELRVHAPGELWSWADLIRLEDLTLVIAASTN